MQTDGPNVKRASNAPCRQTAGRQTADSRQPGRRTDRQAGRQMHRWTERQIDRVTVADRWTDVMFGLTLELQMPLKLSLLYLTDLVQVEATGPDKK